MKFEQVVPHRTLYAYLPRLIGGEGVTGKTSNGKVWVLRHWPGDSALGFSCSGRYVERPVGVLNINATMAEIVDQFLEVLP